MPPPPSPRKTWNADLSMSIGPIESEESFSGPSSPTYRGAPIYRTTSNVSVTENSPLLQNSAWQSRRSRFRLQVLLSCCELDVLETSLLITLFQSTADVINGNCNGKPRLSRNQSRAGIYFSGNLYLHLFLFYEFILISSHGTDYSSGSFRSIRHGERAGSWSQRLVNALTSDRYSFKDSMRESKDSLGPEERVWYDQFTSTDWVHDSIADAYRVKALRSRKDIRGRIKAFFDGTQGWILSALVGFLTATVAYTVDVSEAPVFDWKDGYCQRGFFLSEKVCVATGLFSSRITKSFLYPPRWSNLWILSRDTATDFQHHFRSTPFISARAIMPWYQNDP